MKKYTTKEFAADIRNKYPGSYDDLTDSQLVELWLKKFPQDKDKITENISTDKSQPQKWLTTRNILLAVLILGSIIARVAIWNIGKNESKTNEEFLLSVPPESYVIYDGDTTELNYGYIDKSLSKLCLYENEVKNDNPLYAYQENNGMLIELCHWSFSGGPLKPDQMISLSELPSGEYRFQQYDGSDNWSPFTITDFLFYNDRLRDEFFDKTVDPFKNDVISGTLSIVKEDEDYYTINWEYTTKSGKLNKGHFLGQLIKYN